MTYISRFLSLAQLTKQKSCFLFGPRQTGKSKLIENSLPKETITYDLLKSDLFLRFQAEPSLLRKEILALGSQKQLVVIDEIQKIPSLLNEVHHLIEACGTRFLLTGSSARSLRRSGVNLLGGRAREHHLRPLSYSELGSEKFDLLKALNRGLLPSIYFSEQPALDLKSYVGIYLREEIAAEALTRNIPAFARFLQLAATCNGTVLSPTSISNETGIPKTTVTEYFEILQDTLLVEKLPSWQKSTVRKPIESSKFYFFDCGVARCLSARPTIKLKSVEFGDALEHYIYHEIKTYIEYCRPETKLNYWRSTSGFEVDFVLNDEVAIEVKGASKVGKKEMKGLHAISQEKTIKKLILVCMEERPRIEDTKVLILPIEDFLKRLWNHEMIEPEEKI